MKCFKCGFELQDGMSNCPRCGAYINQQHTYNNFVSNNEPNNSFNNDGFSNNDYLINNQDYNNRIENKVINIRPTRNKDKKGSADLIICLVVLAVWIGLIYLMMNNLGQKKDYYFEGSSDDVTYPDVPVPSVPEEKPSDDGGKDEPGKPTTPEIGEGVSKSGYNGIATTSDKSRVVFDRQYFRRGYLESKSDVLKFVQADSSKNKENCPSTLKSLETEMETKYKITAVNLCEMDPALANELKNVTAYVYNNYPAARGYLTNLTLATVSENATYMAAYMPMFTFVTSDTISGYPIGLKSQIILNTKYFLNPAKIDNSVSYGRKSGYFPKNATPSSTVAHEFGHYLSYVAMLNYYKNTEMIYIEPTKSNLMFTIYDDFNDGDFSKKLLEEAYAEYKKNYGSSMSFDQFRASISSYAVAKDERGDYIYDETIAEAFHDWYLNGNNAKPASIMIMSVLQRYL